MLGRRVLLVGVDVALIVVVEVYQRCVGRRAQVARGVEGLQKTATAIGV